jgi:hypothetical protein
MASVVEISDYLRAKMIRVAAVRQSLIHPEVVLVSQQLDRHIFQAQKVLVDPELISVQQSQGLLPGSTSVVSIHHGIRALANRSWKSGLISRFYPRPNQ